MGRERLFKILRPHHHRKGLLNCPAQKLAMLDLSSRRTVILFGRGPTWREEPRQFDLPANSQIFGRLARDAGYEALLYPSSKSAARCLAGFPENLREPDSFLELRGTYPEEVKGRRLDASMVRPT